VITWLNRDRTPLVTGSISNFRSFPIKGGLSSLQLSPRGGSMKGKKRKRSRENTLIRWIAEQSRHDVETDRCFSFLPITRAIILSQFLEGFVDPLSWYCCVTTVDLSKVKQWHRDERYIGMQCRSGSSDERIAWGANGRTAFPIRENSTGEVWAARLVAQVE